MSHTNKRYRSEEISPELVFLVRPCAREKHRKCGRRRRWCLLSEYQQRICTFYPRRQEIPPSASAARLGMGMREWVSSGTSFILKDLHCPSYPSVSWPHTQITKWRQRGAVDMNKTQDKSPSLGLAPNDLLLKILKKLCILIGEQPKM